MTPGKKDSQAIDFMRTLRDAGWFHLSQFVDSGHTFELFSLGGKPILVQIYPSGHGFEVWRPVTSSANIAETAVAVQQYGASHV